MDLEAFIRTEQANLAEFRIHWEAESAKNPSIKLPTTQKEWLNSYHDFCDPFIF